MANRDEYYTAARNVKKAHEDGKQPDSNDLYLVNQMAKNAGGFDDLPTLCQEALKAKRKNY